MLVFLAIFTLPYSNSFPRFDSRVFGLEGALGFQTKTA
jgi:hypothetical protein